MSPRRASVRAVATASSTLADPAYFRYPDLHGDQVVFSYGGDLWLVSTEGGAARRLTAHPGQEIFGRFSPDGQWVTFDSVHEGTRQIYGIDVSEVVTQG